MHVGKLPVAIPILQARLSISLVQAGLLLSTVQAAGMFLGLLVGLLADRAGPRRVMLTGLVVLALSSAAGAASLNVWQLLASRVGEGLGFLLAVLPAAALLRQSISDPATLLRALGWWGTYMPAGIALTMLLGTVLIESVDWRLLWLALSAMSALCAILLQWHVSPMAPPNMTTGFVGRVKSTLKAPGPWLVAFGFFLYTGQWLPVVGFLPTIYREVGFSPAAVGVLSAFAVGINFLGSIRAGWLLSKGMHPSTILTWGFAVMGVGSFAAFGSSFFLVQYLGVVVFSIAGGFIAGVLFSSAVTYAPSQDTVATTVGWMQQWNSLGQFFMPPLVATLAVSQGGWEMTWVATGACSLAGIGVASILKRVDRRPAPIAAGAQAGHDSGSATAVMDSMRVSFISDR